MKAVNTTAAVVRSQGAAFQLEEVELDELRRDELLVRMVAVGVCHTDISVAHGLIPFPLPGVLGHEGAGVVEAVGTSVTRARVGDRVLLSFTSCGTCDRCRGGHPALCDFHLSLNLVGGRRADGTATVRSTVAALNAHFFGQSSFAALAIVDERSIVRVAPDTSDDELITLAPLGCGFQTGAGAVLNVLRPTPGSTLVITGAGAVGLAALMAAAMSPAGRTIVVDRSHERLALALELGATHVIDTTQTSLTDEIGTLTGGHGADYVVETTGNTNVLEQGISALSAGGTCAIIGAPRTGSKAAFDVNRLLPGRVIRGVTLGDADSQTFLPFLIDAWKKGRFPIERLERRYAFVDINSAVLDASRGATIKPVLVF